MPGSLIVKPVELLRNVTDCDSACLSMQQSREPVQATLAGDFTGYFSQLFNTADWPARWHCGHWTDFHGWLYIISDLFIWAAYFAIPILLFRILNSRKDIPFPKVLWLFIAFIVLCGTTHLIDALIFWWPAYRLSALLRFLTGVVSIFTVFALYKHLPLIYNLRTIQQLEAEIEERKKAEQEARHHQVLQQAAEELMAKKDEFMSITSHELKTPITSVKLSLQVLEKMVDKHDHFLPVAPFVEKAARQVNKLTGIINDLLDVTKIHAGQLELYKTDFKLKELILECIEQSRIAEGEHIIHIEGDPNLVIHADRIRIEQVLSNILTNAFKYSLKNETVVVWYEKLDNGLTKIAVTDNGIGIAADKIDHIFDRFYRVENNSQYFSGVGLGLYISSQIVKRHDGEIGVISEVGKGSTFWFTI